MPCILHIETATEVCSVAISKDSSIIFQEIDLEGPSHAVKLAVFVNEALTFLREQHLILDAVAVSSGPGSYTGLRIGISEAKGLCYGLGIPLIAIDTLKIMASVVISQNLLEEGVLLCPMIDARRMEVYNAIYDKNFQVLKPIEATIIDESSFAEILGKQKILFFGNGAKKCEGILISENAIFVDNIYPTAAMMTSLAEAAFKEQVFVDIAYFEPFYLKEFVATVAKNKVLPS